MSVCLRNSSRPCESRSHLSGTSCSERGSGALDCRRAGRLGRGDVSLINISPSGIGSAFFPFVVSCFGSFGPSAVRCLFALADLEARQHESLLSRQVLPPMDPSACSQYRAICYRQSSARKGHAVAKASVMSILGVPRLPLPQPIPSALLARNCHGPADSVSPPAPLTYASSLRLLPSPSIPSSSESPAPSP